MTVAQNNLTWHEIRSGDLHAARRRLAAVDRLSAQCGDDRLRALARANLAEVARLDGRYVDAVMLGRRALSALAGLGDPGHRRRVLGTIGLALAQDGRLEEAVAVLRELRVGAEVGVPRPVGGFSDKAVSRAGTAIPVEAVGASRTANAAPGHAGAGAASHAQTGGKDAGGPLEDGVSASIEAVLALRRGDQDLAAEWFTVAAQAYAGTHDLRDVAEALVGLVATTDDPTGRAAVLDWLAQVCRQGGITLLPRERAMIEAVGAVVPGPRHDGVLRSGEGADNRR
jgi:hypothetical protein